MIDWIKTAQGVAAIVAAVFATMVDHYSDGFSWYLFGPDNRLQHDIAGTLGNGSWGYIVGTYDKDAGPNNQLSQRHPCRANERYAAHRSQLSCPWAGM